MYSRRSTAIFGISSQQAVHTAVLYAPNEPGVFRQAVKSVGVESEEGGIILLDFGRIVVIL